MVEQIDNAATIFCKELPDTANIPSRSRKLINPYKPNPEWLYDKGDDPGCAGSFDTSWYQQGTFCG